MNNHCLHEKTEIIYWWEMQPNGEPEAVPRFILCQDCGKTISSL